MGGIGEEGGRGRARDDPVCLFFFLVEKKLNMNVDDQPLEVCSKQPSTGWDRSGYCKYKENDGGRHIVCATMTDDFLNYTKTQSNDLTTSSGNFPGLKSGDNWCICAGRYTEAAMNDHAPLINRKATNKIALQWPAVEKALILHQQQIQK